MENNHLDKLWGTQDNDVLDFSPKDIIKAAKKQRNGQYINIAIMVVTVSILIVYASFYAFSKWNTFNLGLTLMISSLVFRILLEFYSAYRKEAQLISLDHRSFLEYLRKYYKTRLVINYLVTPLCIVIYAIGFTMLLPYFKQYFSKTFYNYLLISGIASILFVIGIIIYSTLKEQRFLKQLSAI